MERRAEKRLTAFGGVPQRPHAKQMRRINFPLTVEELKLLAGLASDQLFRRQYIDPRIPGYKSNPEEVDRGKALVVRMRLFIDEQTQLASESAQRPASKQRILKTTLSEKE